jgi:hypothetical protein
VGLFWYLIHGVPVSLLTARRSSGLDCLEILPKYTLLYQNTPFYKHTRSHHACSSTQQVHSQHQSKKPKGQDRHRQAKHHRNTDSTSRNSTATHAHPWAHTCQPRPAGLCKHTQTCTVHEKNPPTQPDAKLAQSACKEGCPTDPPRASCFVTQRMQEFHCRPA